MGFSSGRKRGQIRYDEILKHLSSKKVYISSGAPFFDLFEKIRVLLEIVSRRVVNGAIFDLPELRIDDFGPHALFVHVVEAELLQTLHLKLFMLHFFAAGRTKLTFALEAACSVARTFTSVTRCARNRSRLSMRQRIPSSPATIASGKRFSFTAR